MYTLMDDFQKIQVKRVLCAHHPPTKKLPHRPPFEQEHLHLYYELFYHPTAFILTAESFAQALIGIKWLLKTHKNDEASLCLNEQLQRVLIWGRHHPLLIESYRLLASLELLKRNEAESMAGSLKAFQVAISSYGDNFFEHWQLIVERVLEAASIHEQFSKYEQALELFGTASDLLQMLGDE
jgi:tetratricopeptide (TPR) repeat protein